ncbi:MAG: ATP-dependent DNA ligase [Acidobacteriota bacterium]|nr:ATP-dependent DNA ligase [Acidobacteriota bacterium]
MEARVAASLPPAGNWQFEPKWDGFRCLVFKGDGEIRLQSKSGQPLERYFPEIVARVRAMKPSRFVLDGELVVPDGKYLSFDDLLQRIHPAASRVARLAAEHPAALVLFDLLDDGTTVLAHEPLVDRRARLETFFAAYGVDGMYLSPATRDRAQAVRWLSGAGGALDGVIAKVADAPYGSGTRDAMIKVKNRRTADCVAGGFRYASGAPVVGSLLLGLYDEAGLLHHVGFTSSFKAADKPALTATVKTLEKAPGFTGRAPGGPSRWSTERSSEWVPLEASLVVEVEYDHFSQSRFRHGTKFMRWRPDKLPRHCTFDQVAGKGTPAAKWLQVL